MSIPAIFDLLAYGLVMVLPVRWRFTEALIPYAAFYAKEEPARWQRFIARLDGL